MARPVWQKKRHVWGIDFVRFSAALLVAFFHLTWVEPHVASTVWYGWIGVQIFFVISGLVIAGSANATTPVKFIESRLLRLYPAAWICAPIGVMVAVLVHHHEPDLPQRFFASFMLSPVGPYLSGAYWTLPVEMAFYTVIFLVLMAGAFDQLERVGAWLAAASVIYNVCYALQQLGMFRWPDLEFGFDWKNITLLRHGIYFAIGIFIWLWSERRLGRVGWVALALAVAAAPVEIMCRTAEVVRVMPVYLPLAQVWPIPLTIWVVALAAIVGSAGWQDRLGRPPAMFLALARSLGLATYPLYLVHQQFGEAARNVFTKAGLPFFPSVCLAILCTTLVALLIAKVLEPALRGVMRMWLEVAGTAAVDVRWLQRLFRPGGTV
jgi:peptidoglycan/LPS O-acetylase OafA/YrhL